MILTYGLILKIINQKQENMKNKETTISGREINKELESGNFSFYNGRSHVNNNHSYIRINNCVRVWSSDSGKWYTIGFLNN